MAVAYLNQFDSLNGISAGMASDYDPSGIDRYIGTRWYALSVRSRHEKAVANCLGIQSYQVFVPTYQSRRCWSDRIKELEMPLFPGYVFCRFDIHRRLPVLMIPGVQHIVGGTATPSPIDPLEIDALQRVVQAKTAREPWPFLQTGDRLRIERGALRGVEGILLQLRGHHRLIVSITLLQRSVSIDIDSAFVSTVSHERGTTLIPADLRRASRQPA